MENELAWCLSYGHSPFSRNKRSKWYHQFSKRRPFDANFVRAFECEGFEQYEDILMIEMIDIASDNAFYLALSLCKYLQHSEE